MEWLTQAWSHIDFNPHLTDTHSYGAIGKMIGIDLLLSLDNALVIALVARGLPAHQQRTGIILGTGAAIALRLIFALVAAVTLQIWYVRALGGLWLVWVAVKLLLDEGEEGEHKVATTLLAALVSIGLADAGMSLDNVLALAALANGNVAFIWIGVLISIPFVMFGAEIARLIVNRAPLLVWVGAVFLGYVAGNLFGEDPALHYWLPQGETYWPHMGILFASLVLLVAGFYRATRYRKPEPEVG